MKTPTLINAERMAEQHPERFARPSDSDLLTLAPGDHVKVCLPCAGRIGKVKTKAERFWIKLTAVEHHAKNPFPILEGMVANHLLTDRLKAGDEVRFHTCNVYEIFGKKLTYHSLNNYVDTLHPS